MNKSGVRLKSGLTTDALLAAIQAKPPQSTVADGTQREDAQPWRLAAAVLQVYDPGSLVPFGAPRTERAADVLQPESVRAVGWRDKRYRTLLSDVRIAALAELGDRASMRRALAANPDREMTGVQVLFEAWLDDALQPEKLGYGKLEDLRQLYEWGLERFGNLPRRADFDQLRARRAGLALFEHLVDESFVGRERELQRLRDFVGVVEPSLWTQLRAFLFDGPRGPLVLCGPGGVGKTALIGRFLMDHVENRHIGWFPFAYLPFDSEILDVRQPWTLLAAAADQLSVQVMPAGTDAAPREIKSAFLKFRAALAGFRDQRAALVARTASVASQHQRTAGTRTADDRLGTSFGNLLRTVASFTGESQEARRVPVLLVLDTFEEVLYRAEEDLIGLWRMLNIVQKAFPALRILISGRGDPPRISIGHQSSEPFPLDELDESDALLALQRQGVADPKVRAAIVAQVGRSPLTLKLAARAAREEVVQSKGFNNLRTTTGWLRFRVAGDVVRGQLYQRILNHIHDEGVKALAHPGMALRKVTPDLIRNVLAPVCLPGPVTKAGASKLFEALRLEHSLVRLEDDSSLRYREEVRTPMLGLLAIDKPDQLRELRRRAVEYYASGHDEPAERAEELYNRMMLGQPPEVLDRRWMPGVERYLGTAVEEIPNAQKIWLARHMSIRLPEAVYAQADLAAWEELIGGRALELLRYNELREVQALLAQRTDRTPQSPLYAIELRTLMGLGEFARAFAVGQHALENLTTQNPGRLSEALWLTAQAAKITQSEETLPLLARLAEIARTLSSRLPEVQALAELILFAPEGQRADLRDRLAATLDKLDEAEIDSERPLLRLACVRLGGNYPRTLARMMLHVTGDLLSLIASKELDMTAVARPALDILRKADPRWKNAALDNPARFAQSLIELVHRDEPETAVVQAVLVLMSAEQADLSAATLAGLDSYRESFELRAAAEVVA